MKPTINCPICNAQAHLIPEPKKRTYRSEKFDLIEQHYQCDNCAHSFTTDECDDYNLKMLHNKYREKYQIPFPEQLIKIRESYGLTQTKMSELLGFGPNQFRLYENGEMPSSANAMLLKLLLNPKSFKDIVLENIKDDADKLLAELLLKIEKHLAEANKLSLVKMLFPQAIIPNSSTGFAAPDFQKFAHMVIYFLDAAPYKTKLNKLLFYADFTHFKYFGRSISGCEYAAINMGPVPDNYKLIFGLLEEENFICSDIETLQEREVDKFSPCQTFNPSIFSDSEKTTLELINSSLGILNTQALIDKSHAEIAWQSNEANKFSIDYALYAPQLKAM